MSSTAPGMLVIDEDVTDPSYGHRPEDRPPETYLRWGVINLDKPPGPTSHQVAAWVKQISGMAKAGHGGTLDPNVSGVLPVALADATSALAYAVSFDKQYIGVMRLHGPVSSRELARVASLMEDRIYQRPPKKSAVRRKLRTRRVHSLRLLETVEGEVLFDLVCEKGFYVRKLVHDLGLILGVEGHMQELRRIRSGVFCEDETLVDLFKVKAAFHKWFVEDDFSLIKRTMRPYERIFAEFPKIVVRDSAVSSLCHGAQLAIPGVLRLHDNIVEDGIVSLFTDKGEVIAVARARLNAEEVANSPHGIAATLERVFMPRDLYPRKW